MALDQHLNLLCWEGYDHPKFLEQLHTQTQIQLSAQSLVSDHAAAQQVMRDSDNVDVLNINNPYPKKVLYPANKIWQLDKTRLSNLAPPHTAWMQPLQDWGYANDGSLIGVCQRFGSFNLVINSRKISRELATSSGFKLPEATDYKMPYGILQFPEFNIFHICIAAGLNPFKALDKAQLDSFTDQAKSWFKNATMVTEDSNILNRALVRGDISFYLSGGVFVAGAARLEGHHQIECITPASGSIDGRGAISFVEVNSITRSCRNPDLGYQFLNQILEPECVVHIATNPQVCNPVLQMQDKQIFSRLSSEYLNAIQWETLEEDINRCAVYDIPPQFSELLSRLTEVSQHYGSYPGSCSYS